MRTCVRSTAAGWDTWPGRSYAGRMVALRKRVRARMTLDEFVNWDPGDPSGRTWQLIDGEPVAMAPGSELHAALQGEITRLLGNHLLEKHSPCRLLAELGIVPRVRANQNFRVPDLGMTCALRALVKWCRRRYCSSKSGRRATRRGPGPTCGRAQPFRALRKFSPFAACESRQSTSLAKPTRPSRRSLRSLARKACLNCGP